MMRFPVSIYVFVVLTSACALAQMPKPYEASDSVGQGSTQLSNIVLSGKVQLEGGGSVPGAVAIQLDCSGQLHTKAYVDVNGGFNFRLTSSGTSSDQGMIAMPSDNADPIPTAEWQTCDLVAQAPGYGSSKISLSN